MTAATPEQAAAVRWRKKPVVVDAVRWTGDNADELEAFSGDRFDVLDDTDRLNCDDPEATASVFDDLHSTWVLVMTGQWIIKGVKGEFCPCADDVFAETYEPAAIAAQQPHATDGLLEPLHALAAKWDATAARNQRNGQSLLDQGDEYGSEGLAVAEALGACVVDLRAVLADAPAQQPAPGLAAAMAETASRELAAAMAEARGYRNALQQVAKHIDSEHAQLRIVARIAKRAMEGL